MEVFDSIVYELFINGAWADISADVLYDPFPRYNNGIMGDGPLDRTGDPENLFFSLNNSASCSGGVAGYYTPGHANMRSGWRSGLKVQITYTYDGVPVVGYSGWINPDGIEVKPGIKGERTVAVSCTGFMGKMADHNVNLLAVVTDKTQEQAAALLLANMPVQPNATDYGTGASTFPSVFDTASTGTTALAELHKLNLSELGYAWCEGDGTFTTRGRDDLTGLSNTNIPKTKAESGKLLLQGGGYLLLQGGGKRVLNERQTASFDNTMLITSGSTPYGKHYYNRVKTVPSPRKVGADTIVLWTLQEAIEIPANSSKTIRGTYRDPSGGSNKGFKGIAIDPVSGTDFKANSASDGSGSDQTSNMTVTPRKGAADTEFVIANISGASIWTGGSSANCIFQIRGQGIYFYDVASNDANDGDLQSADGVKELTFDMKYQSDPATTALFNSYQLDRSKTKRVTPGRWGFLANRSTMDMMAFLYLKAGTRANFIETQSGISGNYFIMGREVEIHSVRDVRWYPTLVSVDEMDFVIYENAYPRITENFTAATAASLVFDTRAAVNGGSGDGQLLRNTGDATHTPYWSLWGYLSSPPLSGGDDNSGYEIKYASNDYKISDGGVEFIFKFKLPETTPTVNGFAGFMSTGASETNGVYFKITGGASATIAGKTANSSTVSTTGTSYTLSTATWYKGRIHINTAGTLVTYQIFDDFDVSLWSQTLSTNIPAAATSLYPLIRATKSAADITYELLRLTYFTAGYIAD